MLGESWVKRTVTLVYFIFVLPSLQQSLLKTQIALCVAHSMSFLHDSEGFYDNAYIIFMKLQYNTYTYLLFFLILMNYGDSNYLNPALASFLMWSLTLIQHSNGWISNKRPYQPRYRARAATSLPFFRLFGVVFSVHFLSVATMHDGSQSYEGNQCSSSCSH